MDAKTVYFTNVNGVELTKQQYENLSKVFSYDTIATLNEEQINLYKNNTNLKAEKTFKYIKIETDNVDMIDTMNRSKPFLYVDGKIYIGKDGETHTDVMRELDMEVEGKRRPRLSELPEDVSFGFGHISNGIGFVDENARNCTVEEVAKAAIKEDGIKKVYTSPSGDKYITRLANNRLALVYGE